MNFGDYTVKNVKSFTGMDGYGYNATLCKGGRKVAFAIDEGCGGEAILQFDNPKDEQEFDAYLATLPPEMVGEDEANTINVKPLTVDATWFMGELVEAFENDRRFRRLCKTKTLFRLQGDEDGTYRTIKAPYDAQMQKHLTEHYGGKVIEVLNHRYTGATR